MTARTSSATNGFTLVELMIAVAVIAVLAVVAIPEFVKYQRKSRTVEMVEMLEKIGRGARSYFDTKGVFPINAGYTPLMTHATACAAHSGTFPESTNTDFNSETWNSLLVHPEGSHRYRYSFVGTNPAGMMNAGPGGRLEAWAFALGDLDCDGNFSLWRVSIIRPSFGEPFRITSPFLWSGSAYE